MAAKETFIELRGQAIFAYSSWITYLYLRHVKEAKGSSQMVLLMNELYFTGIGIASQTHTTIGLHNLYDREKNNTHNLEHLLSCCKKEGILTEENLNKCQALMASVASGVKANSILRGNLFAHSGKSEHPKVFNKADFSLENCENMFQVAFEILQIVAEAQGFSIYKPEMIEEQVLGSNRQISQLLEQTYAK